jgi:Spy/CpxP family protein refolding chaperone
MTKQLLAGLCVVAIAFSAPRASCALPADDSGQLAAPTMPSSNEFIDIMVSKLSLSDDQKVQLAPIIASRQQRMKAILADTASRPMQRRRQAKEVMSDSDKKINAILSPDQQQKYAALEQQMREQFKQRMQEKKNAASN